MKKINLFIFFLFVSSTSLFAQNDTSEIITFDNDSSKSTNKSKTHKVRKSDDIQTLSSNGKNSHFGFYGALSFKGNQFRKNLIVSSGGELGIIINRSLSVSIGGEGFIPSDSYSDIIPNEKVLFTGGYGGLTIEPVFYSNKVIHFTTPISMGSGWVGYITDWQSTATPDDEIEQEVKGGDVFWYIEPGVDMEINIAKYFRVKVGAGYFLTQGFDLINTPSSALNGFNTSISLKIGRF